MPNSFIRKLQLLAPLDVGDVAALERATAISRVIPARRDLIREGDRPGPIFVILEGWACRYKILPSGTRQILAYLMPGDCCDLNIGLLAEMDHSIQTVAPCRVVAIDRPVMDEIVDSHAAVAKAMYISQLIDEGTMRAWITSMGRRSSIERVAHLMCELYLRARNVGLADSDALVMPLSQVMLADSLGMTPVHINRVLGKLREEGAMALRRGSLRITDPSKLNEIAGFDENYLHRRLRIVN